MFGKRKQREYIMNMFENYKPTSKSGLKSFCIMLAKGDVKQAGELYDFYIKDMDELPMFDPVPPSWMDNTKNAIGGFFNFIKENQDGIGQVTDIVRSVISKRGGVANTTTEALPPIN